MQGSEDLAALRQEIVYLLRQQMEALDSPLGLTDARLRRVLRTAGPRARIARKAASRDNCGAGGCFNITGNFDGGTDIGLNAAASI